MNADRQEIEALSARFKLVSAVMTPLREHGLQIEIVRGSLLEQRVAVQHRYSNTGGYFFFTVRRLIVMFLVVLVVFRRCPAGTFRHLHDGGAPEQILLLPARLVGTGEPSARVYLYV